MTRFPWWLVLVGCSTPQEEAREVCDALLACASIVNPFIVRDFEASYGEEGVCWETAEDVSLCAQSCETSLTGLWIEYDHADGCDPSDFVTPGSLTVEQFFDQFDGEFCAAVKRCDPNRGCYGYYGNGSAENCEDYDPLAADLCLSEEMVCNDANYYSPYPIVPTVCADVCD